MDPEVAQQLIAAISLRSESLANVSLAVVGGSVLTIVSTSYIRPKNIWPRLMYFLFLPSWALMGFSLQQGDFISRRYIASRVFMDNPERILQAAELVNSEFSSQLSYFSLSLMIMAGWLFLFLLWWIFGEVGGRD